MKNVIGGRDGGAASMEDERAVWEAYRSLVDEVPGKSQREKEKKQREWIWEYVLKFCPDQSVIEQLLTSYEFPDDSVLLKRMLLLKILSFQLGELLLPDRARTVLQSLAELCNCQPLVVQARNCHGRHVKRCAWNPEEGSETRKKRRVVSSGKEAVCGACGEFACTPASGDGSLGLQGAAEGCEGADMAGGKGTSVGMIQAVDAKGKRVLPKSLAKANFCNWGSDGRNPFIKEAILRRGIEKIRNLFPSSSVKASDEVERFGTACLSHGVEECIDATGIGNAPFLTCPCVEDVHVCSKGKEKFLSKWFESDGDPGREVLGTHHGPDSVQDRGGSVFGKGYAARMGQPPGKDVILGVMIELTVQHLRDGFMDLDRYREALERHWGSIVEDTEDRYQDDGGVVQATRQELWEGLEEPDRRRELVCKYTRDGAERILTAFLKQAWAEIGPTFFERIEAAKDRDKRPRQEIAAENMGAQAVTREEGSKREASQGTPHPEDDETQPSPRSWVRVSRGKFSKRGKQLALLNDEVCGEEDPFSVCKNLEKSLDDRICNMDEGQHLENASGEALVEVGVQKKVTTAREMEIQNEQTTTEQERRLSAVSVVRLAGETVPEVDQAIKKLRESEMQLHKAVKDPLPQALVLAGEIQDHLLAAQAGSLREEIVEPDSGNRELNLHSKLMNCHPSVQYIEEDISDSPDDTQTASTRVILQRPRESHFSPLLPPPFDSPPKIVKPRRRVRNKWSETEVETLKREVTRYGKGRWKFILKNNLDVFATRTEVDLKDKWRNIQRADGTANMSVADRQCF